MPNDASGIISAGDAGEVMVILLNDEGWGMATNITGTLNSASSDISILNPVMNFGDANPGMPIINDSNPFQVELSSSIQLEEYNFEVILNNCCII